MINNFSTSPMSGFVYHRRDIVSDSNYDYILYISREGDFLISRLSKDGNCQDFAYFSRKTKVRNFWENKLYLPSNNPEIIYKFIHELP